MQIPSGSKKIVKNQIPRFHNERKKYLERLNQILSSVKQYRTKLFKGEISKIPLGNLFNSLSLLVENIKSTFLKFPNQCKLATFVISNNFLSIDKSTEISTNMPIHSVSLSKNELYELLFLYSLKDIDKIQRESIVIKNIIYITEERLKNHKNENDQPILKELLNKSKFSLYHNLNILIKLLNQINSILIQLKNDGVHNLQSTLIYNLFCNKNLKEKQESYYKILNTLIYKPNDLLPLQKLCNDFLQQMNKILTSTIKIEEKDIINEKIRKTQDFVTQINIINTK